MTLNFQIWLHIFTDSTMSANLKQDKYKSPIPRLLRVKLQKMKKIKLLRQPEGSNILFTGKH